jgi:hypothetical protein
MPPTREHPTNDTLEIVMVDARMLGSVFPALIRIYSESALSDAVLMVIVVGNVRQSRRQDPGQEQKRGDQPS